MDNKTENVILQANGLWRLLTGLILSQEQETAVRNFIPQRGRLSSIQGMRQLLQHQPRVKNLREHWDNSFSSEQSVSLEQAIRFLNDLISGLELVDEFFHALPIAGITRMQRDAVGDAPVRRPAGKSSGWSLIINVEGAGRFNSVREHFNAKAGDMVLLAPGALYDYARAEESEYWEHHWVYCNPSPALMQELNWPERGPYIYHLSLPDNEFRDIKMVFRQLLSADTSSDTLAVALRINLTDQIFLRSFLIAHQAGGQVLNPHVKRAMDFIDAHLHQPMTIEAIAEAAGLSRTRLSALFKDYLGRSMINWRDERRMAKACQMLTGSDLKVRSVAEALGYEDALYFSRQFTRIVGKSPRAYRKDR